MNSLDTILYRDDGETEIPVEVEYMVERGAFDNGYSASLDINVIWDRRTNTKLEPTDAEFDKLYDECSEHWSRYHSY